MEVVVLIPFTYLQTQNRTISVVEPIDYCGWLFENHRHTERPLFDNVKIVRVIIEQV